MRLDVFIQYCKSSVSLSKKVDEQFIPANEFLANLEAKLKFFQVFISYYSSVVKEVERIVLVFVCLFVLLVFILIFIHCQNLSSSLSEAEYGRTNHKDSLGSS